MPRKRKKKDAPARAESKRVRAPKRGMYLEVVITDRNGFENQVRVESFRDITTVGYKVANQVRDYLRTIPLSTNPASYSLQVYPRWIETAAPPAGKRGAGELEDADNG